MSEVSLYTATKRGRLAGGVMYTGISLIRNLLPLGPYSRPVARALWWS